MGSLSWLSWVYCDVWSYYLKFLLLKFSQARGKVVRTMIPFWIWLLMMEECILWFNGCGCPLKISSPITIALIWYEHFFEVSIPCLSSTKWYLTIYEHKNVAKLALDRLMQVFHLPTVHCSWCPDVRMCLPSNTVLCTTCAIFQITPFLIA